MSEEEGKKSFENVTSNRGRARPVLLLRQSELFRRSERNGKRQREPGENEKKKKSLILGRGVLELLVDFDFERERESKIDRGQEGERESESLRDGGECEPAEKGDRGLLFEFWGGSWAGI